MPLPVVGDAFATLSGFRNRKFPEPAAPRTRTTIFDTLRGIILDNDKIGRWLGSLRRALRLERRQRPQELQKLTQLSEAILDHGRMLQSSYQVPMEHAVVEVSQLAIRLRETPETITKALGLLEDMGRAERFDRGSWRVRLAGDAPRTVIDNPPSHSSPRIR